MPTADGLLAIPGVLQDGSAALDEAAAERRDAAVLAELGTALDALKRARREEGARLEVLVRDQIDRIEEMVGEAETISAGAPEALRDRIREQVALADRRCERPQP